MLQIAEACPTTTSVLLVGRTVSFLKNRRQLSGVQLPKGKRGAPTVSVLLPLFVPPRVDSDRDGGLLPRPVLPYPSTTKRRVLSFQYPSEDGCRLYEPLRHLLIKAHLPQSRVSSLSPFINSTMRSKFF